MTEDNRRQNVLDELERAAQSLRAAEALAGLGLASDSVSRAFYGAHHLLRAVLFTRGLESKTHAGALHLFNLHFVRAGEFSSSNNRILAGLQRARELADYAAAVKFSTEDAQVLLDDARRFESDVRSFLAAQSWLNDV